MPAQPESTLTTTCAKLNQWNVKIPSLLFHRNFLARHFLPSPFLLAWHVLTSLILEAVGRQNTHQIGVPSVFMEQRCPLSWSSHLGLLCDREVNLSELFSHK